ncbi:histidine phosphatase family protein [Pontibacter sp. KCTC 32443]|uniref:SixA phosphatase family protein n=1 Tax=Pontibacter TaxID=323449 RepID=UPI00164D0E5E|nr:MULTISPECIES: histidine phosphatase family protein [Pontibacter]MBC5774284.1 histidine phosphatase family protein [Pontibacter sp. KCTC 32443]
MKTLYILRHAKSSWEFEELSDHDRPLNKRGRNDASLMGRELSSRGVLPSLIVSSPAVRAISTATLIGKELGYDPDDIVIDERIYGADKNLLLEVVQETPVEAESMMIIGHNDALTEFANMLSSEVVGIIPTAGVVALNFDCESWYEISRDNAEFLFFDFPKNYE